MGGQLFKNLLQSSGSSKIEKLITPPSTLQTVSDGETIDYITSNMLIVSDGGEVNVSNIGIADNGSNLLLQGTSNTDYVTLVSGGNLKLNNEIQFSLLNQSTIEFIYQDGFWLEKNRNSVV